MLLDFNSLVLDELSDAIIAKSPEGRVMYWSRGAERVFGFARDEAIGELISKLIIPPDRLEEEQQILRDVVREELSQYETTRRRKDGAIIYVDVSSKAIRKSDGEVDFILSSNKDVTRLKVLRDAKLVAARYGNLLESTPDGIIMANTADRIVLTNSQADSLFGYNRGELLGKPIEALLPPGFGAGQADPPFNFSEHPKTRSMGAGMELFGVRKDGTEFPVEISLSRLETSEGAMVISAIRDVTDRKRAEQKIRDQTQIMNLVNNSVLLCDLEDRITEWNQGAQRLYGWSKEEVLGQRTYELLKTVFPSSREEIRAQVVAEGHWEGELVHTCRDGTMITVASRWTLQKDASQRPTGIIELNYDITERKRFERTLQEKNIELQNAAESKNRFLANMSHELRTPLNGIIGFAEFLTDGKPGPLNAKQKEYLTDILNSGRHLLQLINDVLDLAKVEANRMDLHPEKFILATAIEGVCAVGRPIAQKKRIEVTISVAPEIGEVYLDPQKFKQVLYNLISNAVKFTDDNGRVEIKAGRHAPEKFSLSVRDTGIGIRAEDLPRLFTEFEQLDSGASRRYEGTGLGLALTRKIIEMQGGTISVKSEIGQGTTFTVILPIHSAATTPERPVAS